MKNQDSSNYGGLWKNSLKVTESNRRPSYKGFLEINGVQHKFDGWVKKDKNGESYISVSIGEPKESYEKEDSEEDNQIIIDEDMPF